MNAGTAPHATVVGGDAATRSMLRFVLQGMGCDVREIYPGTEIPSSLQGDGTALLVVVGGERDDTGLAILGRMGRSWHNAATMLLTRDTGLETRRRAFSLGAHDIVSLPIGANDLQARLRALVGERVRRDDGHERADTVRAGGLILRMEMQEVSDETGWSVRLTRREAALLRALMLKPGQTVGYEELLDHVWAGRGQGHTNALAVFVRRLRVKLARLHVPHGYVRTAHGRGYLFDARSRPRQADQDRRQVPVQVLVVDDDGASVAMMVELLQGAGYSVASTAGAHAPVLARQGSPTVILLDINMPGMDGVEVRRRLRESPRTSGIPVVALSAGRNLRLRAAEMGADDYLSKPFSTDELLLRVEKWAGEPATRLCRSDSHYRGR